MVSFYLWFFLCPTIVGECSGGESSVFCLKLALFR